LCLGDGNVFIERFCLGLLFGDNSGGGEKISAQPAPQKGKQADVKAEVFFLPFFFKRFEQASPHSAFAIRYKHTRTKFPI